MTNFKMCEDEVLAVINGSNERDCKNGNVVCDIDNSRCDYSYSAGWKWYHKIPLVDLFCSTPNYANWRCHHSPKGDPTLHNTYLPYYDGVHGDFMSGCSHKIKGSCSNKKQTIELIKRA